MGVLLREKHPLQPLHVSIFSSVGLFSGLRYVCSSRRLQNLSTENKLWHRRRKVLTIGGAPMMVRA